MKSSDVPATGAPICGSLGCHADAAAVINHPQHGRRTVCQDHAEGYVMIHDV